LGRVSIKHSPRVKGDESFLRVIRKRHATAKTYIAVRLSAKVANISRAGARGVAPICVIFATLQNYCAAATVPD